MGGVEDSHWVDMIIDEIGAALSKVDESIQKSIELWTELTKDILSDQPTQDLTGQPNNGESGEEHSSQEPLVQVEERPLQHWSMHIDEVKEKPIEHWAMRASKIPECLIQEQVDDDGDGDGDSDGDYDDHVDDDDDYDDEYDDDYSEEEEEDETTASEEDSGSSLKWKGGYELLMNVDTSSSEENDDEEDDDETIVTESSENTWDHNLLAWATSYSEEDSDSSLKWKGYRRLNNVVMSSEEDNESWDDDDEDDDETTASESSESMLELNLGASATSYIPSSFHHHNEEDSGSSLKWNGGYQLLKNADTSSEEDEVEECYLESVEQVMEVLRKHRMSDLNNESFVCLDDVSDRSLFPECDWVYVTRD